MRLKRMNPSFLQSEAAMSRYIEGERPFTILDFGCGPGRDLKAFTELGHLATGLEGAAHLAAMARAYSGCEVWQQDFLKLDLPDNHFDGVFANASTEKLYHTPGPYNGLPKAWIGHKIQMKIMGGKSIHAHFRLAHRKWPGCDSHGR
jgi:SAM-dependent methyltransferase